jgi:ribosomal protein S18 acetylase RimI-like enzyme
VSSLLICGVRHAAIMRTATREDADFISQCIIDIFLFLRSNASDIYIDGLPTSIDDDTMSIPSEYIQKEDAIALISEIEGKPAGCLLGKIETTSFPASGLGKVGHISICWVSQKFRNQNIGSQLVREAENWFATKGVNTVELSYMAKNVLAEKAWERLGYEPFRIFAHKVLRNV